MMKKHNIATLEDHSVKKNSIELDVNWDPELKDYVRLLFNGEEAYIKKSDLFSFMFVLATPEQQDELIPVSRREVRPYERQHRVKLTKDMKEGEELVVNCMIHVPTIIDEAIRNEIKGLQNDNEKV